MALREWPCCATISVHLVYPSSWESVAGKGTFMDETVEDALAAIDWARGHASVDSTRYIILGHSLGATLAPLICSTNSQSVGRRYRTFGSRPSDGGFNLGTGYLFIDFAGE